MGTNKQINDLQSFPWADTATEMSSITRDVTELSQTHIGWIRSHP